MPVRMSIYGYYYITESITDDDDSENEADTVNVNENIVSTIKRNTDIAYLVSTCKVPNSGDVEKFLNCVDGMISKKQFESLEQAMSHWLELIEEYRYSEQSCKWHAAYNIVLRRIQQSLSAQNIHMNLKPGVKCANCTLQ